MESTLHHLDSYYRKSLPIFGLFSVIALASFIQNLINLRITGDLIDLIQIGLAHLLVYNLVAVLIPLFLYLGRTYPLNAWSLHVLVHLIASVLFAAIHLILSQTIYQLLWEMPNETFINKLSILMKRWFLIEVLVYWIIILVLNLKIHLTSVKTIPSNGTLSVKQRGKTLLLDLQEINWIQAYDAYVKIHTSSGTYLRRGKISTIEKLLPPESFQRIHRSSIVNLSQIKALQPHTNGEQFVILKSDEKLKLSRSYKAKASLLQP